MLTPAFLHQVFSRLEKSHVAAHARKGPDGKTVQVGAYDDKRSRHTKPTSPRRPAAAPGASLPKFSTAVTPPPPGAPAPDPNRAPATPPAQAAPNAAPPARLETGLGPAPSRGLDFYEQYIASMADHFEPTITHLAGLFPDREVSGRIKQAASLAEKVEGRKKALDSITDLLGFRVHIADPREADAAVAQIHKHYQVLEDKDYNREPKDDGYRGRHLLVKVGNGAAEIQLKTPRQTAWSDHGHDRVYKGKHKDDPKAQAYMVRMARWYAALDLGRRDAVKPPPCTKYIAATIGCLELRT